jgi:hypothetical protein
MSTNPTVQDFKWIKGENDLEYIKLLDDCQSEFKGIMVFGLTQEKQISVELIPEESLRPYTEPDTESIRKEAYQQGINDAREGKASCQFCEYEMCSDRADPCRICACNYMNFFEPKKQEEMDGLRQNIQTIVDQCGYSLDEIAEVLAKMKETNNG